MGSWVRGECIGKGSFGTVTIGVHRKNGAVFAVKSVDRNSCSLHQIESLENEIRILRSLSSPYIVKFIGDDETTSFRNLHMEYMPGGTVADVARRVGADVDGRLVRYYTWCVVSALRLVHAKRIVHCDVKGKNVLVGRNSSVAKLADFGSANEYSGGTCKRAPIGPRGSPLWMAPEVIRGESQGPESDVWSLGCTVIEMVTGKPAWEDCGADSLRRIGFLAELPQFPSGLSELGCDFLEKCLRRDPTERWSCDQLLQHPFLLSESPNSADFVTEPSPRCVLDWVNSEFEDERDNEFGSSCNFQEQIISAKERIGKLASSGGVVWENDNWELVREGEGTSTEYPELIGTSSEYWDSAAEDRGVSWELWNFSGGDGVELDRAGGMGRKRWVLWWRVNKRSLTALCRSLLVMCMYYLRIFINKLLLFFVLTFTVNLNFFFVWYIFLKKLQLRFKLNSLLKIYIIFF